MTSLNILRTFPNETIPDEIIGADGLYLVTTKGDKYLDLTGGFTAHNTLGWGNQRIIEAIHKQLLKYPHVDYKSFVDPNRESLAKLYLSHTEHKLDRLFLCGGSGGEACEAAIHLSYQVHYEQGNTDKSWIISRTQSYHGATTDCMAIGERPNLEFYRALFPKNRAKIQEHNHYRHKLSSESDVEYGIRSARELEEKILEIGPDSVSAFVAETMMGGLVGDVPPTPNYWSEISQICKKYNVHLILDEVWCGSGISGKNFCIDYDHIRPDFIFVGKTFASGYLPISAVVTSSDVEKIIMTGSGRVENSTTFQGHSACVAAALACQQIISEDGFLSEVSAKGEYLRNSLHQLLGDHEFFRNIRGRGMRNSLEYKCPFMHQFGLALTNRLKSNHHILINAKWHRITLSNAMTISYNQINIAAEAIANEFRDLASTWNESSALQVPHKNFF